MGQGLTGDAAATEAWRILQMALKLLDVSGNFVAAAHVAHAIDLMTSADADADDAATLPGDGLPDNLARFVPDWGKLVDRHACAG